VPRSTSVHCRQLWDDYGDPEQFETPCEQTMNDPSKDFLRISCAVNRLSDGMWGGLQRPDPVAAIKQEQDQKKPLLRFSGRTAPQGCGREREIGDLCIRQASSPI
jgi:hypothetical protein